MPVPIGPLISLGGALLGGLFGGPSKEEKEIMRAQAEQARLQSSGMREGLGFGRKFAPMALRTFQRGAQATQGAVDYWRRILSGRTGAAAALSPEINQIVQSYRGARQAGRTLNPRGGGSSALTRRIDEEVIPGQISGLLATARPTAAREIGTLGTNLLQSGVGAVGTTGQMFGLGSGAGSSVLQYGPEQRKQQISFGEKIGSMIEPILREIPGGDIFGGGGTAPKGTRGSVSRY